MFYLVQGRFSLTVDETKCDSSVTCSNAACRRVIAKPIKAFNLQLSPEKCYDACPYCLTEISANDEKAAEFSQEKPSSCVHYIGYLHARSAKGEIPDECLMCKEIIHCMLQNMKG